MRVLDGVVGRFLRCRGVQPQSERSGGRPIATKLPRLVFVNKMDPAPGAKFSQRSLRPDQGSPGKAKAAQSSSEALKGEPQGIIDLVVQRRSSTPMTSALTRREISREMQEGSRTRRGQFDGNGWPKP